MFINFLVSTVPGMYNVQKVYLVISLPIKNTKNYPQSRIHTFAKLKKFFLTALIAQTAQTVKFLFSNVACRPRPRAILL